MSDPNLTSPAEFLQQLAFVQTFGVELISHAPGEAVVEMPYHDAFAAVPGTFPASIVGMLGDVAAVTACLSRLPEGWSVATLDYTIKMTGAARGERLRAVGSILQGGKTTSVGQAIISAIGPEGEASCGSLLATARNFELPRK